MNLMNLTISEAGQLLREHKITSEALVQEALQRANSINDEIKPYIHIFNDNALTIAKACDSLLKSGHILGPLHGIPIALKDNIHCMGAFTTAGSSFLRKWCAPHDATIVNKLRSAGAVFIGKTNLHEFAWGGTSENPHYGSVRNPWDTTRFAAGSSGGSGAAVAARTCLAAIGTDTGGSIRLPSSVNGVTGIRPTYGRVSNYGIIPLAWSMDTAGPMAKTAQDCAILLSVMAGQDINDDSTSASPVPDYPQQIEISSPPLRIGVIADYSLSKIQSDVYRVTTEVLEKFKNLGSNLITLRIPDLDKNMAAVLTVESAEPSTYHQRWLREYGSEYGDDVRLLLQRGELLLATQYIQAQRYRAKLRASVLEAFNFVDVIITPTLPFTAVSLGATEVTINHKSEDMLSSIMQFTGLASLTGMPAISIPAGFDRNSLPVGVQFIGKPYSEELLFSIGHLFQKETDHHLKIPPVVDN